MSKSISKTKEIRSKIEEMFFTPLHWIAQDATGYIYIYKNRPRLGKLFSDQWLPIDNSMAVQFLGKTTKTRCNKTYTQACAQLTIDNWYLDRYGRLIVEDRNTPNLLKEQAY